MNHKLSAAVAAVLAMQAAPIAFAADDLGIEEVVVTAQRRSENIQDVPIAMQALTSETLSELKVATMEDFIKYLPSVTTAAMGPGQSNIYMRGLSLGAFGTQGSASIGQWPNVAVYLDDQSTQIPGRNLDVYAADLERIEVLEGPQGTLFGAGAQAGVLRYITNKPKQGVTEGSASASYGTTAHGSNSSKLEAVLNLPLSDKLAMRAVIYNDSRGGYIDNVFSTFTRRGTDLGFALRTGGVVPADSVVINNAHIEGKDINPVTYKGIRVGLAYDINDDWHALLTQSYQDMNTSGVFYQMPVGSEGQALKPLEVTLFNDGKVHDQFSNTALTVNGKVGSLDLVYTGAILSRHSEQIQDYTNYARGVYGAYYQCTGYSGGSVDKCYTPSSTWHDTTKNVNQSHEFRVSTPTDWKLRGIAGVFWEKRELNDDTEWLYKSVPECSVGGPASCFLYLDPSAAPKFQSATGNMNNPGRRNPQTGFFDDFQRTYTQKAFFASADWDIIDKVTLTVGTRYYDIKNQMLGGNVGSFFCKVYGTGETGPCTGALYGYGDVKAPYGTNLSEQDPNTTTVNGFKSRVNLSWRPMDDVLVYATWSQGFRPGGFNRGSACQLKSVVVNPTTGAKTGGARQWCVPYSYESDSLVNKELGWKTTFYDNRIQFNGAVYEEEWKNAQTGIFAPQLGMGNLTVGLNGPTYKVQGVEMSLLIRATQGLTIQGSGSYNKSKLTNSPQLINNVEGSPGFGQPVTEAYIGGGQSVSVENVYGVKGQGLANSPKFQGNARARYEWTMGEFDYYWQAGLAHQSESSPAPSAISQVRMPAWTVVDASAGVSKGNWSVELVGSNLGDVNKSLLTSGAQFIQVQVPQRPRTLALQIGYKFKD
jgi:outer membrane receptor protein involved in Fe transport